MGGSGSGGTSHQQLLEDWRSISGPATARGGGELRRGRGTAPLMPAPAEEPPPPLPRMARTASPAVNTQRGMPHPCLLLPQNVSSGYKLRLWLFPEQVQCQAFLARRLRTALSAINTQRGAFKLDEGLTVTKVSDFIGKPINFVFLSKLSSSACAVYGTPCTVSAELLAERRGAW